MGKGVVCPFFSNYLFATSRCIEKEAVDKMIAHFVTAPCFGLSFYRYIRACRRCLAVRIRGCRKSREQFHTAEKLQQVYNFH